LFDVLGSIQTEAAVDALVVAVAAKARQFDLGDRDAIDAMKTAIGGLKKAFETARRPAAQGKQPIVASLVQILVQTPPRGEGLDLIQLLDETLTGLTGEKIPLAAAIKELTDQSTLGLRPQLVDLVWLQQLNWMERLLQTSNKDLRLLSRPEVLDWTPQQSVEVIRKMQNRR
jgi:hypothetical protein